PSTAEGEGPGRLATTRRIIQKLKYTLLGSDELKGKKVIVTAGATREPLDPVRFITNHASGKMGFALAEAAKLKGAEVVLIAGANQLDYFEGTKSIEVATAEEMKNAVFQEYENTDILLMAAAVADYKPKYISTHKLKKTSSKFSLELQKTSDILAELGVKKDKCLHVGFALETENGVKNATKKLHAKNLDLIVLNNPLKPGAAFSSDTNIITLISKDGTVDHFPKLPKTAVANIILEKVCEMKQNNYCQTAVS
ncbi:MAG: bifunctional phosphopantothenoylcysteine decarboxylase/phosphopantothenate--cysteine ligase CoaBC, partial [bacterium]